MEKSKEMYVILSAYDKSGIGPKAFAANQGLTLGKLKYWLKKRSNEQNTGSSFIQVKTSSTNLADHLNLVEVYYPNGVKVKANKVDFAFLSQLIKIY